MAPAKAPAARVVSSHAKKPSASSRAVVPAIPLAMMSKQASKTPKPVPDAKAAGSGAAASLDAALIDHGASPTAQRRPTTKGKAQTPQPATKVTDEKVNGAKADKHDQDASTTDKAQDENAVRPASHVVGTPDGPMDDMSATSTQNESAATSLHDNESAITNATTNGDSMSHRADNMPNHHAYPIASPGVNKTPYSSFPPGQLPPHINSQHPADMRVDEISYPAHQRMHHPRLSNGGNIMFGGFPESHTPSPAPMSGGFIPPPPLTMSDGIRPAMYQGADHHHSSSIHNGFPAPVRGDAVLPPVSMEGFGHMPAPSTQTRFGPGTPLSFHGSHTSMDGTNGIENGGPYAPGPGLPPPLHAGPHHTNGPRQPGLPFAPPFMPPGIFNQRASPEDDPLGDALAYFRAQFDNAELSDCTLELVYANGRYHPAKLAGHRLVLCRSPVLKQKVISAQGDRANSGSVVIHSDDKYVRSDAWWMAIQRLYLHPLLTLPPLLGDTGRNMEFAGDNGDKFEFCLGYVAAGHLLQLRDVLIRGLQVATDLLNWRTVETALGFVLENSRQRHTDYHVEAEGHDTPYVEVEYAYGPETRILMDGILNFLINAFPANFELDAAVSDQPAYARIPAIPAAATGTSPTDHNTIPAIARGSNSQHKAKPSRLGNIKFGDLPSESTPDAPSPAPQPAPCSPILSRILLNLPYDELRVVLCYENFGVSGWKTFADRARTLPKVIAARETRRFQAVEAVRSGLVPDTPSIQERLSANRRHAIVEPWDVLNWQESPVFPAPGAPPTGITRNWSSQFAVTNGQASQPRATRATQSMV